MLAYASKPCWPQGSISAAVLTGSTCPLHLLCYVPFRVRAGAERWRRGQTGTSVNGGGPTLHNCEAPAGRFCTNSGRRWGDGVGPRAVLFDTQGAIACEVCRETFLHEHRAVSCSCAQGRHVLHVGCLADALARSEAPPPLRFPSSQLPSPEPGTGGTGRSCPNRPN